MSNNHFTINILPDYPLHVKTAAVAAMKAMDSHATARQFCAVCDAITEAIEADRKILRVPPVAASNSWFRILFPKKNSA